MARSFEIEKGPFEPTWESLRKYACPDWFRDAKLGIWAHWGPQCVPMFGDWYARRMYIEGEDQYLTIGAFTATRPKRGTRTLRNSGRRSDSIPRP